LCALFFSWLSRLWGRPLLNFGESSFFSVLWTWQSRSQAFFTKFSLVFVFRSKFWTNSIFDNSSSCLSSFRYRALKDYVVVRKKIVAMLENRKQRRRESLFRPFSGDYLDVGQDR
jgi:hypothetical protein